MDIEQSVFNEKFLNIMKSALRGTPVASLSGLTAQEWNSILSLAESHKVLPLVYETIYKSAAEGEAAEAFARSRRKVRYLVMNQTVKTEAFLELYQHLLDQGLKPLVVKGIVCRGLYPYPDHRISSDEDVWIQAESYDRYHEAMLFFGMYTEASEDERKYKYEISYFKKDSALFIELHKNLFAPEAESHGDWNRFFEGAAERAVADEFQGRTVYTLGHTDHLFYLICHAFKHFIHSGFGIRQVCDIVMYANAHGAAVDWEQIYRNCCEIHAEGFVAAVFEIGRKYLVFDPQKAGYPDYWRELAVDEAPMLEDMLSGGIYGSSTMSRKHSSNITLDAVAADKKGRRTAPSLRGSLFPPAKNLTARYPYLRKYPWLVPVAWADRILKYGKEIKNTDNNNALEAVKIGNQRIELLRQYGVIK